MGIFTELQSYVDEMRAEAEVVAKYEGDEAGERIRRHADRLEARIDEIRTRELTPREAARECAWSGETVSRRIGDGTLPAGPSSEDRARTVRRCDLYAVVHRDEDPREPKGEPEVQEVEGPDVAGEILTGVEA